MVSDKEKMNAKTTSIMIYCFLLMFLLIASSQISAEVLTVGKNMQYQRIQAAIDAADPYDTVQVSCGRYEEVLQLLKPLNLQGEPGCTILTHSSDNDLITISADNCTISGFTIQNARNSSYSGLFVLSDGNSIINNTFINNSGWGVYLYHCEKNTIIDNDFTNDGICMVGSRDEWVSMTVSGNMVLGKPIKWLANQQSKTINDQTYGQLVLINSSNCVIDNITVSGTDQGIVLAYSENCTITNTTTRTCRFGIRIQYSDSNLLSGNLLTNHQYGFYITHSDRNLIMQNIIQHNTEYGCYFCCNSKGNTLSKNRFINNTYSAYDYFENDWSKDSIGNYYSDYTGVDNNNDGIGDSPYEIPPAFGENIDSYPIIDFEIISQQEPTDTPGFSLLILLFSTFIILQRKKRKKE
jgi:parallel beta-helix repeat protein